MKPSYRTEYPGLSAHEQMAINAIARREVFSLDDFLSNYREIFKIAGRGSFVWNDEKCDYDEPQNKYVALGGDFTTDELVGVFKTCFKLAGFVGTVVKAPKQSMFITVDTRAHPTHTKSEQGVVRKILETFSVERTVVLNGNEVDASGAFQRRVSHYASPEYVIWIIGEAPVGADLALYNERLKKHLEKDDSCDPSITFLCEQVRHTMGLEAV